MAYAPRDQNRTVQSQSAVVDGDGWWTVVGSRSGHAERPAGTSTNRESPSAILTVHIGMHTPTDLVPNIPPPRTCSI